MLSYIFLLFAAIHIALWIWGFRGWNRLGRPVALTLVLFGGLLLWYDNFRIGIGRFIGEGELLKDLTFPAFAWHYSMLPLLVIAAGSIARLADLNWARSKAVMGAFCVVAVGLMAYDIPAIPKIEFHPACLADTVRYTTDVKPAQLCSADQQPVSSGHGPVVAIATNLVVLAVGIALWIQRKWPWLAAGSGAMFVAAGAFGQATYALPVSNLGEICITLGFIVTALHFARLRQNQPGRTPAVAMRQAA